MSVAEQALVTEMRRLGARYANRNRAAAADLATLRDLWLQAKALGMTSTEVAAASKVSPATIRMAWNKTP